MQRAIALSRRRLTPIPTRAPARCPCSYSINIRSLARLTGSTSAIRMGNVLEYREPLPDDCPPPDAEELVEPRIVYRLVRNNPPGLDDFRSFRALNPDRELRNVTECQMRGVSVFINLKGVDAVRQRRNLRRTLICAVVLDKGAGRILLTNPETSHCAWWPLADYDILANCQVIE